MSGPGILRAAVLGTAIWGPGLEGWEASRAILAGSVPYEPRPSPPPPPSILSPTERRRAGPVVRLALSVAHEAAVMSGLPPDSLRSVFASSSGDGVVVTNILHTLADSGGRDRVVSPTQFHNSVHNAAAGYWSIATGGRQPATCLGCHDSTFAAGLLKAIVEVVTEDAPVLLCAYDHPLPPPMDARRPIGASFGVGLVLAPIGPAPRMATVGVRYDPAPPPRHDAPTDPGLAELARQNATARALCLLQAVAGGATEAHSLGYLDGRLDITVAP